uniref:Uncharacterized protein n=1 Tax=viral metagenome TaxID=1070528 RepID=A0A6C0M424_9ZZZZ
MSKPTPPDEWFAMITSGTGSGGTGPAQTGM